MTDIPVFHAFGVSHLAALTVIAAVGIGMIALVRGVRSAWPARVCESLLALVLIALPLSHTVVQLRAEWFDLQSGLPCHYCDWAAFAGALALWTHRQAFCEICYFFGLAGTLQGLITPALQKDFPDPAYFYFFIGHGAVVVASLYVMLGLLRSPQPGAVKRAMVVMSIYALSIGAMNAILGTNYGFLCYKSPNPSLLDYLGPWPWYIGSLWLVGLLFYSALYLPFWLSRRGRAPGR